MFNTKIKIVQTDGGGKYKNKNFQSFFHTHGIHHQFSCPHHPEQNGLAERKHRHLVETGLTLLALASMSLSYWAEAFHTATYLINRLPTRVLQNVSLYHRLFHKTPQYDSFKVFGCAYFPYLHPYNQQKLQFRSKRCVFLGYFLNHHGYRCLDLHTGRVFLSRHVVFDEHCFPFKDTIITPPLVARSPSPPEVAIEIGPPPPSPPLPHTPQPAASPPPLQTYRHDPHHNVLTFPSHAAMEGNIGFANPSPPLPSVAASPSPIPPSPQVRESDSHPTLTRAKASICKPNPKYAHFIAITNHLVEPTCFSHAQKSEHWRKAMVEEFNALQKASTWTLVSSKPTMNILPNKWVFNMMGPLNGLKPIWWPLVFINKRVWIMSRPSTSWSITPPFVLS